MEERKPAMSALCGCLFFLIASGVTAISAADTPVSVSGTDVRQRLAESAGRLESFHAVFEIRSPPDHENPLGDILHREVAAMQPAFVLHLNAHGNSQVDWSEDLRCQRTLVSGSDVKVDWVRQRAFQRWKWDWTTQDALPGSLPLESFFKSTGLWPLDQRLAIRNSHGVPYALSVIANDDRYVCPDQAFESINGCKCRVLLRAGFDKLWLDESRGLSLVARELYDSDDTRCTDRYELSAHTEAAPGIWVPCRIRHIKMNPDLSRKADHVLVDYVMEVLKWKVNDLTADSFEFKLRPGELWLNPPNEIPCQVMPGGEDYVEEMTGWAVRNGYAKSHEGLSMILRDKLTIVCLAVGAMLWFCLSQFQRQGRTQQ